MNDELLYSQMHNNTRWAGIINQLPLFFHGDKIVSVDVYDSYYKGQMCTMKVNKNMKPTF